MPTYKTGDAIGTASAKNLFDDAQDFDNLMLGSSQNYPDRLGRSRLSYAGFEALAKRALSDAGYTVVGDYSEAILTLDNYNQIFKYDGEFYKVKASVSLPYTTTGTTAGSWESEKDNFVAVGDATLRQELNEDLGKWFSSVVSIFTQDIPYESFKARGFYASGDGGQGVWRLTGVTDVSKSGTHVIREAKVYDASGNEYQLSVGMGFIDPRANGAKPYITNSSTSNILDLVSEKTEDFVCVGQAINGILSTVEDRYYPAPDNRESAPNTTAVINITYNGLTYRVGREAIKFRSHANHVGNGGSIYVYAAPSQEFSTTGVRINAFEHGAEEILAKYNATKSGNSTGDFQSWSSVSLDSMRISDLHIFGDHASDVSESDCSANIGIFLLNPQYCWFENIYVRGFQWAIYTDQINRTATSGPFQNSSTFSQVSGVPQFGNFYGCYFKNVRTNAGRKGLVYSRTDWTTWEGGSICDDQLWAYEGDKVAPDYFLVQGGSGFKITGCNFTVQHGGESTERWQPAKSVAYIGGNGVTIENNYLEHTPSFLTIGSQAVVHKVSSALGGIKLDMIGGQYRPVSSWKYITFEENSFPYYDDAGNYQFPDGWVNNYTAFSGMNLMRIGSPVQDFGAFAHGGFDFKYGTYNTEFYNGLPDVDHWRDTKRAKEFLTPYGLQVNSGNIILPFHSPAFGSNICIWIKDLTGNFDASKIVAWNAANIESGSSITDANTWMATGQVIIDYNNGYKLIALQNLRWSFDGLQNWSPSASLYVQVDSATPIILKSVQAFTGGIPFFPSPMNYKPSANPNRIWGSQPSGTTNATTGARNIGGGMYRVGDIVEPWMRVNRSSSLVNPATDETNFPSNSSTKLITGGCSLGGQMLKAFTVTVTAQDTVNNTTTVNIDDPTMLPYIVAGQLFHLTGTTTGTTAVTAGDYRVLERVSYTSSTTNPRFYKLSGIIGDIGAVINVDNNSVAQYSFNNNSIELKGGVTATGNAVTISASGTVANSGTLSVRAASLSPYATNTTALGSSAVTWKDLFVQNSPTVVSDANFKESITSIPDNLSSSDVVVTELLLEKILAIKFQSWKLKSAVADKGEDSSRWHVGVLAQDICQAFTDAGLDWTRYGVVTMDTHSQIVTKDSDGNYYPVLAADEDGSVTEISSIPVNSKGFIDYDEAHDTIETSTDGIITLTRVIYMVRMEEFTSLRMVALEHKMGLYA